MSRRSKTAARLREIARRNKPAQDHTSHLTALRNEHDASLHLVHAADAVRAETPILAEVIRRVGIVPEPPCTWEQGTTLLPLVADRDDATLVGA